MSWEKQVLNTALHGPLLTESIISIHDTWTRREISLVVICCQLQTIAHLTEKIQHHKEKDFDVMDSYDSYFNHEGVN